MTHIDAVILGIVEGITEFLPISSTFHLELVTRMLGIVETDFVKSVLLIMQLGAIASLFFVFPRKFMLSWKLLCRVCIGFIPTGIIGFLLYKIIKQFFFGNMLLSICVFILGGVLFLFLESTKRKRLSVSHIKKIEDISIKEWLYIGIVQAFAAIPGVSRSGAIISWGLFRGIPREVIIESAFLLAVPTMLVASLYDVHKNGITFSGSDWSVVLTTLIVSFVSAFIVSKWLLSYISKHDFKIFGWYRIILGIILLVFFFI